MGKSPEMDDLLADLLEKRGNNVINYFYKMCTAIWKQNEWPSDWRVFLFDVLLKTGDTFECSNNPHMTFIGHSRKITLHHSEANAERAEIARFWTMERN